MQRIHIRSFIGMALMVIMTCATFAADTQLALRITSQPAGASIKIDHRARGVTPCVISNITPGQYLVQASLQGYESILEVCTVAEAPEQQVKHFNLSRETGFLLLQTTPEGCDVSSDGTSRGVTPLLLTTLPTNERYSFTFSKPGYIDKTVDIRLEDRTPVASQVTLMRDAGIVNITTEPSGVEVLLNGISMGVSPREEILVPKGGATIEFRMAGYTTEKRTLTMAAGDTKDMHVVLNPSPAQLCVVTIPAGGRVYIDDQFCAAAPYTAEKLKPGRYRVRVEKKGYASDVRDVVLTAAARITEEFRMRSIVGRVEVRTTPADATVIVDGQPRGKTVATDTTQFSVPFAVEDLDEGTHTIELQKNGYTMVRTTFTVAVAETTRLELVMQRKFIPDYEVVTARAVYRGVLIYKTSEGVRLEVRPGVEQTLPMGDIRSHGPLKIEAL